MTLAVVKETPNVFRSPWSNTCPFHLGPHDGRQYASVDSRPPLCSATVAHLTWICDRRDSFSCAGNRRYLCGVQRRVRRLSESVSLCELGSHGSSRCEGQRWE